jgi:hypothetical protein
MNLRTVANEESMNETTVLLVSMRSLANLVAYCSVYEFEDVVQSVTGADRVEPEHRSLLEFSRRVYKYTRLCTRSKTFAHILAPPPHVVKIERDYDLFFPVFNHPHELYALAALPDWRRRSRVAACYIMEVWPHLLPDYLLELLAEFDCIFLGSRNAAVDVGRITGRPCVYLPGGVDVLTFMPRADPPSRVIDVCNIGRRAQSTHDALLNLARARRNFFYYYDTVAASGHDYKQRTFHVHKAAEHRLLLASILQRSQYYIANRARANEPAFTVRGDEISFRFYEGAAAGTVMIGEPPRGPEFERQFDWPDAIVPMPFEAPNIADLLMRLDDDETRVARIRRDNMYHAALRHDWVYRIHEVFSRLGLPPTQKMLAREEQLRTLAALTRASPSTRLNNLLDAAPPPRNISDLRSAS